MDKGLWWVNRVLRDPGKTSVSVFADCQKEKPARKIKCCTTLKKKVLNSEIHVPGLARKFTPLFLFILTLFSQ